MDGTNHNYSELRSKQSDEHLLSYRVAIVDDDGLTQWCIRNFITTRMPRVRIVCASPNGLDVYDSLVNTVAGMVPVDCILIDMSLANLRICRHIRRYTDAIPIVGMASVHLEFYGDMMRRNGGQGVVRKDSPEEVMTALDSLMNSSRHALPGYDDAKNAHERLLSDATPNALLSAVDVFAATLVQRGRGIRDAAEAMGITESTARGYLLRLRRYYECDSTGEAIKAWKDEWCTGRQA